MTNFQDLFRIEKLIDKIEPLFLNKLSSLLVKILNKNLVINNL